MFPQIKTELLFVFRFTVLLVCLGIAENIAMARSPLKFDEFGNLSCANELVRLDNYGDKLRTLPGALAVIVIYGGRFGTKRGEVVARLFSIRDALVRRSSIDTKRIVILDGGFLDKFRIDLWIIPSDGRDSVKFLITSEIPSTSVHLKGSTITTWKYGCDRKR